MLEPVGMSPAETLLPRNQKGEGLVGREGLPGWTLRQVPRACRLWSRRPPQAPAPRMGLPGHIPSAPFAHSWLGPGKGLSLCSPSPALALLGPGRGLLEGGPGLTLSNPPSSPEAERPEEQPMEVSVCSRVPVLSVSREPGGKRDSPPRWTCRVRVGR